MRYIKYNIIVSIVIVLLILQQSRKNKVIEGLGELKKAASSFPGMGSIRKEIDSRSKGIFNKLLKPILDKFKISTNDAFTVLDSILNIIAAIGECTIKTLEFLFLIISKTNILQEIVLDTNNILSRLNERINILLNIGDDIVKSILMIRYIGVLTESGFSVSKWLETNNKFTEILERLFSNLGKLFTRTFVDLYEDIVDISSLDLMSLVSTREIMSFIRDFGKSIDKIRYNVGRIEGVLKKLRKSLKKLNIDIDLDITNLLNIGKMQVKFLNLSPETIAKQKIFGGTIQNLVKTASRTAVLANDITKLGKSDNTNETPKLEELIKTFFRGFGFEDKTENKKKKKKIIAPWEQEEEKKNKIQSMQNTLKSNNDEAKNKTESKKTVK